MDSKELDVLRTKLLLCDAELSNPDRCGKRYAVVIAGTAHFRFPPPHNRFYETEREALEEGVRLALAGVPYWKAALEATGKPIYEGATDGDDS